MRRSLLAALLVLGSCGEPDAGPAAGESGGTTTGVDVSPMSVTTDAGEDGSFDGDSTFDEQPGVERVEISVTIAGASTDRWYALRGEPHLEILGWSAVNADGHAAVHGWVPVGTMLELVSRSGADGPAEVVAGAPVVEAVVSEVMPEQLLAFYQLGGDRIALHSELSLPELNALTRRDLGLPPEMGR